MHVEKIQNNQTAVKVYVHVTSNYVTLRCVSLKRKGLLTSFLVSLNQWQFEIMSPVNQVMFIE